MQLDPILLKMSLGKKQGLCVTYHVWLPVLFGISGDGAFREEPGAAGGHEFALDVAGSAW